jgi:hypothetical protein
MAKTPSPEERQIQAYQAIHRVFAIVAAFFVGVAIYQYHLWTDFEERVEAVKQGKSFIALESSVYTNLYEHTGKWGVVLVNVALAVASAVLSGVTWYIYRKLWRERAVRLQAPPHSVNGEI